MNFLNRQSEDVSRLVEKIEQIQEQTYSNLGAMNKNIVKVSKNVDGVEDTLQRIKSMSANE